MSKVIYKYALPDHHSTIDLPVDAIIRHVGLQNGNPFVWAEHDAETQQTAPREIIAIATGEGFDSNGLRFLGTIMPGVLVFHMFEVFQSH